VANLELLERSKVLFPFLPLPSLSSHILPYNLLLSLPLPSPLLPFLCPALPYPPVLPLLPSLRSRPLNPAKGSGSAVSSLSRVWGGAAAEIEFGTFLF